MMVQGTDAENTFPELNIPLLRVEAHKWAREHSEIRKITVFQGRTAEKFEYVLVFNVEAPYTKGWTDSIIPLGEGLCQVYKVRKKDYNEKWGLFFKTEDEVPEEFIITKLQCVLYDKPKEKSQPVTSWLYGCDLRDRWGVNDATLTDYVLNHGLKSYDPDNMQLIDIAAEKNYLMNQPSYEKGFVPTIAEQISTFLFRHDEVSEFEVQHQLTVMTNKPSPDISRDCGENYFIRKGEYWEVGFQGKSSLIQSLDNIRYIVQLLRNPRKDILASELQSIVSGIALDFNEEYSNKTEQEMNDEGMGTTGSRAVRTAQDNILDRKIKQKAEKLLADLEDAKKEGIPMAIEEAQKEYDVFIDALQQGRNLKSNPDMEKARGNVKNHINRAIENIKNAGLKELAGYLAKRIHKGIKCSYNPDPDNPIEWVIKL